MRDMPESSGMSLFHTIGLGCQKVAFTIRSVHNIQNFHGTFSLRFLRSGTKALKYRT